MERRITMHRLAVLALATLVIVTPARAQEPDARQIAQERASAEADVAQTRRCAWPEARHGGRRHWHRRRCDGRRAGEVGSALGASMRPTSLNAARTTREYAKKEGLSNVTVIEGGSAPHEPAGRLLRRPVSAQRLSPRHCRSCVQHEPAGIPETRAAPCDHRLPGSTGSKFPAGAPADIAAATASRLRWSSGAHRRRPHQREHE